MITLEQLHKLLVEVTPILREIVPPIEFDPTPRDKVLWDGPPLLIGRSNLVALERTGADPCRSQC